jgi:UDPglucose 6-dehydrogenase
MTASLSRIAVVGLGYVGIVSAVGLASLGHKVLGVDLNKEHVRKLAQGFSPIFEPGLSNLLSQHLSSGTISFSDSYEALDQSYEFAFVCVSTPSKSSGEADVSYVEAAIDSLTKQLAPKSVVVIRSTVPIGTSNRFEDQLNSQGVDLASNPEFFSEGRALQDFFEPSRVVVGSSSPETARRVAGLFKQTQTKTLICDLGSAEAIKHASNSYLALRLSFVNELATLCKSAGVSFQSVALGIGLDDRIGQKFLKPGPGWGGSCFPKDTSELIATATKLGAPMRTVEAARESNRLHIESVVNRILESSEKKLSARIIAIWGLTFKAGTDDIRESPAVEVARMLLANGAKVNAFDPMASNFSGLDIQVFGSAEDACRGADTLVVLTEWEEFSQHLPEVIGKSLDQGAAVLDFRGVLNLDSWKSHFPSFWSFES